MKCWYTNANNLSNKIDEFRSCIDSEQPDIVAVTEVWMKDEIALEGYHQAKRHNREDSRKGGGVILFVKSNIQVIDCNIMIGSHFDESVWCLVRPSNSELLLLGVVYRSPSNVRDNNENLVYDLKVAAQIHAGHILVMGDFNYPQIDWGSGKVERPEDSCQALFYETIQDLFWVQHVNVHTRFREGTNPSQLDLVFTNQEYLIDEVETNAPLGKSDHMVLTWSYRFQNESLNMSSQPHTKVCKRNYAKGRYKDMRSDFQGVDWELSDAKSIDTLWNSMKEVIVSSIVRHVPHMKIHNTPKKLAPWWTKKLTKK